MLTDDEDGKGRSRVTPSGAAAHRSSFVFVRCRCSAYRGSDEGAPFQYENFSFTNVAKQARFFNKWFFISHQIECASTVNTLHM